MTKVRNKIKYIFRLFQYLNAFSRVEYTEYRNSFKINFMSNFNVSKIQKWLHYIFPLKSFQKNKVGLIHAIKC